MLGTAVSGTVASGDLCDLLRGTGQAPDPGLKIARVLRQTLGVVPLGVRAHEQDLDPIQLPRREALEGAGDEQGRRMGLRASAVAKGVQS